MLEGYPVWVIEDGTLQLSRNVGFGTPWECRIVDEGRGKLTMTRDWDGVVYLGIYRQEGERLILCFQAAYAGRPVGYRENDWAALLMLHRVKPRK
ncbi:MAG TPA: hypothetical protein VMG10_05770 [Gemmataceae bacterium]|nr:hypothetical protein [Gemmataceae bacterium]